MRASLKRTSLAAVALLLALPACEALQPDYKKASATHLKGNEISSLLTGKSISLSNPRGRSYTNSFGRDGRVMISGGKGNLYGDWKVAGDRYCLTLDEDKREQCMDIYSVGDGTYQMVNSDGTLRNTFKVQ
ncbi:hypothetical protein [Azospirillum rugosum]|uniref:Lipoprotein n=1 Tax=Azospirillum rugosum TaxID=416170 RepID=A0ABS4SFQ2_9PROT|nr:hypothetical protein [Azospirillum rugosum]MBP2291404.1 hypothetical protein [Azospirillum rugosum]MDQ0525192.1 hypothetical protein [Azospirillum rugosum]